MSLVQRAYTYQIGSDVSWALGESGETSLIFLLPAKRRGGGAPFPEKVFVSRWSFLEGPPKRGGFLFDFLRKTQPKRPEVKSLITKLQEESSEEMEHRQWCEKEKCVQNVFFSFCPPPPTKMMVAKQKKPSKFFHGRKNGRLAGWVQELDGPDRVKSAGGKMKYRNSTFHGSGHQRARIGF